LRTFTSTEVAKKLTEEMGKPYFEVLCRMLECMVEFCCTIKENDMHMAELDQIRWGQANNPLMAIHIIEAVKKEYEMKLKNIKGKRHDGE
jgi:hypothetical protein